MTHEEKRRERIQTIMNSIKKLTEKGEGVDEKKLIAQSCVEFGASYRTVREYVQSLILVGLIEVDKWGLLWAKK